MSSLRLAWSDVAEICCTCSVTNFSNDRRSLRAGADALQPRKVTSQHADNARRLCSSLHPSATSLPGAECTKGLTAVGRCTQQQASQPT